MIFYMAKVTKQRDNGPNALSALGLWVTANGFSADVRQAQIFLAKEHVKNRLPIFWEFEVYAVAAVPAFKVEKPNWSPLSQTAGSDRPRRTRLLPRPG